MSNYFHHKERKTQGRVQIKYEVETEHGVEEKELPFVVGVISDLTADNPNKIPFNERNFICIDRENFQSVMEKLNPQINLSLDNLPGDDKGGVLNLKLSFNSIHDFEPDKLIEQIEPLKKLKIARDRLRSLLHKTECSSELEKSLEHIIKDQPSLLKLAKKLREGNNE